MFIQVIQGPCSRRDDLRAVVDSWKDGPGADAEGQLGGTFGFTDDGLFIGVIRFASRELAMANSARPEQDAWAQEFIATFDSPPEFKDYDDVTVFLDGGSDSAGFVQVIQGKLTARSDVEDLTALSDGLREMRPDVIGGTFAVAPDLTFTETVAFTSEAAARQGESSAPPPPEVAAVLDRVLAGATFHDLNECWFASP